MPGAKEDIARMLSAYIATNEGKVDMRLMSQYLEITYDTLEKRMRPFKAEARNMRAEPPKTPVKPSSSKRKTPEGMHREDPAKSPSKKAKVEPKSPPSSHGRHLSQMDGKT